MSSDKGGSATDRILPEWAPENAGSEFASRVMGGVHESHDGMTYAARYGAESRDASGAAKRRSLTVGDYIDGVMSCDRTVLSRARASPSPSDERDVIVFQAIQRM